MLDLRCIFFDIAGVEVETAWVANSRSWRQEFDLHGTTRVLPAIVVIRQALGCG